MKGPAIFLAQFAGTAPPFDKLETMAQWAAGLGYVGVQVPTDPKLFDLEQAAKSQTYCDEIAGKLADVDIVDQRALHASARPARRRASGVRAAVRGVRARRAARQTERVAGMGHAAAAATPRRRVNA